MPRAGPARCAAPVQQARAIGRPAAAAVSGRPAAGIVPAAPPRHVPAAVRPVAAVAVDDFARAAADGSESMLGSTAVVRSVRASFAHEEPSATRTRAFVVIEGCDYVAC